MILETIEVVERRATSRVVAARASPVGVAMPLQSHGAPGETGGSGRAREIAHRVEAPILMVPEPLEGVGGTRSAPSGRPAVAHSRRRRSLWETGARGQES